MLLEPNCCGFLEGALFFGLLGINSSLGSYVGLICLYVVCSGAVSLARSLSATSPEGGTTYFFFRLSFSFFSSVCFFAFCFFSFSYFFLFSRFLLLSLVYRTMCFSCLSYPLPGTWYDEMALRCLLCLLHNNLLIVTLWRSLVTTELLSAVRSGDGVMAEGGYKKTGRWYRGVVKAATCFMARWHRGEAPRSRLRHAAEDAKNGDEGKGGGAVVLIQQQLSTNAETR